jgi:hypothetical protein
VTETTLRKGRLILRQILRCKQFKSTQRGFGSTIRVSSVFSHAPGAAWLANAIRSRPEATTATHAPAAIRARAR